MAKTSKKKVTNKELEAKVEMLTKVNNTLVQMVTDLGGYFRSYVEFNKDTDNFTGWLDEKRKIRQEIMGEKNDER